MPYLFHGAWPALGISTIHSSSLGASLLVISAGYPFLPRRPFHPLNRLRAATARPLNFFAELNFQSSAEKDSIDSVDSRSFPRSSAGWFRWIVSFPLYEERREIREKVAGRLSADHRSSCTTTLLDFSSRQLYLKGPPRSRYGWLWEINARNIQMVNKPGTFRELCYRER